MTKYINELIKNEDFTSIKEFNQAMADQREEVKAFLEWRAAGGRMKGETTSEAYKEACIMLLASCF